jgi:hypothetical protein
LWAYSPRANAIDMRHYDTVPHGVCYLAFRLLLVLNVSPQLDLAYEDVGDPDPNPVGIGRSYEMTFQVVSATPSRATLAQLASVHVRSPSPTTARCVNTIQTTVPQIVASPAFYASQKLFGGRWYYLFALLRL